MIKFEYKNLLQKKLKAITCIIEYLYDGNQKIIESQHFFLVEKSNWRWIFFDECSFWNEKKIFFLKDHNETWRFYICKKNNDGFGISQLI